MIKKILWVFLEKASLTVIQFTSLIILSRILEPADYGIYGVMAIFIAISQMLVDSGFGGALVQKKDLNKIDINTLFFANTAISLVLYFILFCIAPFIEQYYGITGLSKYIRVLGTSILIFAMSQVQNALIIRNLEFRKSAVINIIASIIATIAAIQIARKGYGVWALIFQTLLNSVIVTILMWICSDTRIGVKVSIKSFVYLWKFGSNLLGANILDAFVNNITTSIIPKIDSLGKSGLYFQATKLSNVPINILALSVDKFSFPILSKESNDTLFLERARLINRNLLFIIMPVFPLLSYCSYPIIKLLLGDNWLEVAPYFSLLVLSGVGLFIQVLYRNMIKANGVTKYILILEVVKSIIMLAGIVISAFAGIQAIIYWVLIMSLLGVVLWSVCVKKVLNFGYLEQLSDLNKTIISLLVALVTLNLLNVHEQDYIRFAVVVGAFAEYLVLNYLIRNDALLQLLHCVKVYFSKTK